MHSIVRFDLQNVSAVVLDIAIDFSRPLLSILWLRQREQRRSGSFRKLRTEPQALAATKNQQYGGLRTAPLAPMHANIAFELSSANHDSSWPSDVLPPRIPGGAATPRILRSAMFQALEHASGYR